MYLMLLILEGIAWSILSILFAISVNTLGFGAYNLLNTIILLTMGFAYIVTGFAQLTRLPIQKIFDNLSSNNNSKQIGLGIPYGIACSVFAVGLWASILHLPVARLMLIVSTGGLGIFSILLLVWMLVRPRDINPVAFVRATLFCGMGILLLQAPANWKTRIKYRHHPAFIKAQEDYHQQPNDSTYRIFKQEYQKLYPGRVPAPPPPGD